MGAEPPNATGRVLRLPQVTDGNWVTDGPTEPQARGSASHAVNQVDYCAC